MFEADAGVRALFQEASESVGLDLASLCFEGPEATLVQTANVQPAITVVSLAALGLLAERGIVPAATAGHSLGEYAALHAAGVFDVPSTMRLVRTRGLAMQEAAGAHPGSMAAVIGLEIEALEAICAEGAPEGAVQVANHNSKTQVALTGESEALKRVTDLAKQRGAKLVVPLKVSGAWHSRLMADAQPALAEALAATRLGAPSIPVFANVTAAPHVAGEIANLLIRQVVSPVRWLRTIEALIAVGYRTFVEVGPGKALTGFFKDIDRTVTCVNVSDMESLDRAAATLAGSSP